MMKVFVKDFCEIVQAAVVIFGKQVDNDVLYCGIANQPSHAYSFLYLSNFLSFDTSNNESFRQRYSFLYLSNFLPFHILNNYIFVTDCCKTVQAKVVIFGKQVDNDVLYRGIAIQPSHAYSSLYLSNFLSIFPYCE